MGTIAELADANNGVLFGDVELESLSNLGKLVKAMFPEDTLEGVLADPQKRGIVQGLFESIDFSLINKYSQRKVLNSYLNGLKR